MESDWTLPPQLGVTQSSAIDDLGTHSGSLNGHQSEFLLQLLETNFLEFVDSTRMGPELHAFPPLVIPENTPALVAARKPQFSPVLPGQNDHLYNEEHLFRKQQHEKQQHQANQHQGQLQVHQQHVRPDLVFTPLVSPAVTPLESQINSNKLGPPVLVSFEPLTLPALNAQTSSSNRPSDRRRSLNQTFGEEYPQKRRTPHLTPTLAAVKSRRSPALRAQGSHKNGIGQTSISFSAPPSMHASSSTSLAHTPLPSTGSSSAQSGIYGNVESIHSLAKNSSIEAGNLMGFTMNRLAEHQKVESSLLETLPALDAMDHRREKPTTKRASHKLAEQGRRNRMNQAVYELGKLIPELYHEQVQIPSKATTIELASQYINNLLQELNALKQNHV